MKTNMKCVRDEERTLSKKVNPLPRKRQPFFYEANYFPIFSTIGSQTALENRAFTPKEGQSDWKFAEDLVRQSYLNHLEILYIPQTNNFALLQTDIAKGYFLKPICNTSKNSQLIYVIGMSQMRSSPAIIPHIKTMDQTINFDTFVGVSVKPQPSQKKNEMT